MGMDVMGVKPTSQTGEYFRNNVWWWRPLWNYCGALGCAHGVMDAATFQSGHYNDGAGLDGPKSVRLAELLEAEITDGHTQAVADRYREDIEAMPDEKCNLCHGTGVRKDMEVANGCNKCLGKGKVRPFKTNYPFSVDNVKAFAAFLRDCGGFRIC